MANGYGRTRPGPGRAALWFGWILSAAPILLMTAGAVMVFVGGPKMQDEFVNRFGYPATFAPVLGILEIVCVVLYAVPQTAVLGAIVITGYLGGAVATHVRISDPGYVIPLALGIVAWAGLFLREPRLRLLIPWRRRV